MTTALWAVITAPIFVVSFTLPRDVGRDVRKGLHDIRKELHARDN